MKLSWMNFLKPIVFIVVLCVVGVSTSLYNSITIVKLPTDNYFKSLSQDFDLKNQNPKKYSIGVVYPLGFFSEQEQAPRMCIAAKKLGWDCYIFSYDWTSLLEHEGLQKLYRFTWSSFTQIRGVDFIIELQPSFSRVSPTDTIPTYLKVEYNMSNALKIIAENLNDDPKTFLIKNKSNLQDRHGYLWRYVGDYSGYIESDRSRWLDKFDLKLYSHHDLKTPFTSRPSIEGYPSVYSTNFIPLTYNNLFYCGDTWDKLRNSDKYHNIMTTLEAKGYLQVYGMANKWEFLKSAYKGYVAANGYSLIEKMQQAGVTLILHSYYHLKDAIPTSRIFEAAAASTVIISDRNKFIEQEFGDCVLYIDITQSAEQVSGEIDNHMQWIKDHPDKARELARCAHQIFHDRFTFEQQLLNVAAMQESQMESGRN